MNTQQRDADDRFGYCSVCNQHGLVVWLRTNWLKVSLAPLAVMLMGIAQDGKSDAAPPVSRYTYAMLGAALKEQSSSPAYVLISVRSRNGGPIRQSCVPAQSLIAAIRIENRLSWGQEGTLQAIRIARAKKGLAFEFSNLKARELIEPFYSAQQLADTHRQLAKFTDLELRTQLRTPGSRLHLLYGESRDPKGYRDAAAYVLLEHGIGVRLSDRAGILEPM